MSACSCTRLARNPDCPEHGYEQPSVVRLWHDDIRPAPDGWVWARTNTDALRILQDETVIELSLDHDLGLHVLTPDEYDNDPQAVWREDIDFNAENGLDLVREIVRIGVVPPKIRIHSWNPWGAQAMARALNDAGHDCEVRPFDARTETRVAASA